MGHEAIGIVEDVGSQVTKLKRGDLVVMPFASSDGTCAFCHEGLPITIGGGPAPVRAYLDELLPDVLDGRIDPGRVFDSTVGLDGVPDGYRAMADREAIKVMVTP
jgi:threonine dehydrogenase-like Zn-dependent dehydrogenase